MTASNGHVYATAAELAESERRQSEGLEGLEVELRQLRTEAASIRGRVSAEHLDVHALTTNVRELRLYVELCFDLQREARERELSVQATHRNRTDRMLMLVCAKLGIEVPL